MLETMTDVMSEVQGRVGFITLNRPKALNALSLDMIRALTATLTEWRDDVEVLAVAVRGMGKEGPFGAFCAGGDIRFFHQAALAGDSALEDFFTEEYSLNYLIHTYPKPYIAFMDGTVMGGGMGISQGASVRIVSERTKMAMPETNIGLFPDVGGGYFLSRCPGRSGEYLALTGQMIGGREAVKLGLADGFMESGRLPVLWDSLVNTPFESSGAVEHWVRTKFMADHAHPNIASTAQARIDKFFALPSVKTIIDALEADASEWAVQTAGALRKRSPLMLHVVLEQVRRARRMSLPEDLRMERDLVYRSFHLRPGAASDTVEGIRALAIDKDHSPKWNPSRIEDVTPEMVAEFFESPWPPEAHPLRQLG
ncbi:MAG: enoyl-CoA hydratase/isomerase family protein [Bdellovibrionales bacterium]|nr:enoyl-CoA hydratase/isomerase family protein [Ramlibacter sp.]